jgi:uncharacterized protein (DUF1778 family)
MEMKDEHIMIRLTATEKELLKQKALEKKVTISDLIFDALKIKRKRREKPRLTGINNLINQAA